MKLSNTARTISLIGTVMLLAGCSGGNQTEIDRLKNQVVQLESENLDLKTKLSQQDAATEFLKSLTKQTEAARRTQITPLGQASIEAAPTKATAATDNETQSLVAANTAAATASAHPVFNDLTETTQRPMIEELAALGVFDGMSNAFDPDQKITRAEYARLLYRAYNTLMPQDKQLHLAPSAPPFFSDLPSTHPDFKYVQALSNAGFSVGYDDKTFRPEQPITREEMIGIKVGIDCGKSYEPYRGQMAFVWKFSDSKDVDERFTGYIHQDYYVSGAYGSNIQRAFGKVGALHPKYPVTRAEAAGTLWQMGQWGNHGHTAATVLQQLKSQA
jgi:hypothetical protein